MTSLAAPRTAAAGGADAAGEASALPAAVETRRSPNGLNRMGPLLAQTAWTLASLALFSSIWELAWLVGWADPKLLPPPHVFLGAFVDQLKFFNTATRWAIGVNAADGPTPLQALGITVASTTLRVLVGLLIASVLAIVLGVLVRYYLIVDRLVLPTVTLLSPVSPIAWLPVAIFIFGIGNAPAIFMVVIALFFHMVLATISQIDGVNQNLLNVARTMGATKWQTYRKVIIPAILPGLLIVLRMNLFAAWMVVLVAETTGVGYGMGQVIMLARNTFNPSLVFFCIALIGLLGFVFDLGLRMIQKRILYWIPETTGVLRGL
jgi:NitT/TauT family transport system permease protein